MLDVFSHFMPKPFLERLGALLPGASVLAAARRKLRDETDGLQQVLSLANPPIELVAPPDKSPDVARFANDGLAEVCRRHPDRFPAFIASLPMNNVAAAPAEIDHAAGAGA